MKAIIESKINTWDGTHGGDCGIVLLHTQIGVAW